MQVNISLVELLTQTSVRSTNFTQFYYEASQFKKVWGCLVYLNLVTEAVKKIE